MFNCPNCGWSEGNAVEVKKSDKDFYLEFWGYTLGTPEAEEAWKLKQDRKSTRLNSSH